MKKGITPLTVVFWLIMFLIVFFMFGAKFMSDSGQNAVINNNLTGVEALFFNNVMYFFLAVVLLAILGYTYIGGNQ